MCVSKYYCPVNNLINFKLRAGIHYDASPFWLSLKLANKKDLTMDKSTHFFEMPDVQISSLRRSILTFIQGTRTNFLRTAEETAVRSG